MSKTPPFFCFDLETGPIDLDTLLERKPFVDDSEPPSNKTWKPETIKAKREEHYSAEAVARRRAGHVSKVLEKAALRATTCQILCVNYANEKSGPRFSYQRPNLSEKGLINLIFRQFQEAVKHNRAIVGYNIRNFDLPVLLARSLVHRVPLLQFLKEHGFKTTGNRYWSSRIVDIAEVWTDHNSRVDMPRFEELCATFGITAKSQGFRGDEFSRHFNGTPDERNKALDYAKEEAKSLAALTRRILPYV